MNAYLTSKDQKVLGRLPVSRQQRVLIEEYWLRTKPTKISFVQKTFSEFLMPAMVSVFFSSYFVPWMNPFVNIILVVTWLFTLTSLVVFSLTSVGVLSLQHSGERSRKEKILDRTYVKATLLKSSTFKKAYSYLLWLALFGVLASLGHFVTSFLVFLAMGVNIGCKTAIKTAVKSVLEELAGEESTDLVGKHEIVVHERVPRVIDQ